MKEHTGALRVGIISTVVGGLILAAILAFVPRAWSFTCHAFSLIASAISAFWSHLAASSSVPHWLLYLLVALALPFVCRTLARLRPDNSGDDPYRAYQTDVFFGVRWKWDYGYNNEPVGIWGECPQCRTDLVYSYDDILHRTDFTCETCHKTLAKLEGNKGFVLGKVARQVERKIRTGEWKDNESSQQPPERDK